MRSRKVHNMNKKQFEADLQPILGGSEYGQEVLRDLVEHYGNTGSYAQNTKDRIDDRIGSLRGWLKRHEEDGNKEMAKEEAEKIAMLEKVLELVSR